MINVPVRRERGVSGIESRLAHVEIPLVFAVVANHLLVQSAYMLGIKLIKNM